MRKKRSMEERFWAKVFPEPNSGCWLWDGAWDGRTYASLDVDGVCKKAHHVSWFIHKGRWPDPKLDLCHKCDVRCCVNPDHLWEGTRSENIRDAVEKGRWTQGGGAPFTGYRHTKEARRAIGAGTSKRWEDHRAGVRRFRNDRTA